jgi:hypothetical protein
VWLVNSPKSSVLASELSNRDMWRLSLLILITTGSLAS